MSSATTPLAAAERSRSRGGILAPEMPDDLFEQTVPCSFRVDAEEVRFAILQINESGANRISPRKRVFRAGARLDGTGTDPDSWVLQCVFYNGMRETGVPRDPYPTEANRLIALLKKSGEKTGTLTLPTRGPKRVRATNWGRSETFEKRDYCVLEVTFLEDNEETQTESTFSPPNARSAAVSTASYVVESCVVAGIWSSDIAQLEQLASELEALALAPTDYVNDLEEKARAVMDVVHRIEAAFLPTQTQIQAGPVNPGATAQSLLADPSALTAQASLRTMAELAAQAVANVPGRTRPRIISYETSVSIFDVSVEQSVELETLVELNTSIPDLRIIPARTSIYLPGAA
jgi:prophage DNA circulation protein